MGTKIKFGKSRFAICLLLGLVVLPTTVVRSAVKPKLPREWMLKVIENAKEGNRQELDGIIESIDITIERAKSVSVSKELLPEFVWCLKDKDAQVQLLGTRALYAIRSPEGTKALHTYLKGKNLRNLHEKVEKKQIDDIQYVFEMQASVAAVMALGESGDKSAIPLLKSLQGIRDLGTEMISNPVEMALAQLGAYKSLMNIPPDADEEKIMNASTVVRKIRDPNKIPELIATSKDTKIADDIRGAAIDALAEINPPRIANLYIDIIRDPNNSKALRCVTAMAAGRTKDGSIEKHLLIYANDSKSDIRPYAFIGFVICRPEIYLDRWFEKIMDPNEDMEFRKRIVGIRYVPYSLLRSRRTQIYKCLNASDKDGRPIDEIRVKVWRMINELFNEEATVTLTTRDSGVTGSMRHVINTRIMRKNYRLRFAETQKMVEEEIQRIVNVYNESPNGE
ncbi:MAG: hypothetical protein H8D56_08320 [Planctomycetes bacterium]|nr:hypothetical protein [Planctomycetota bacterium]MBL7145752.1 hypothetical protein [Phycisphaerae bacterium]